MLGLRVFRYTLLKKIINIKKKNMFGLRRVHGYTRILATPNREFLNLRSGNRLHTIFGCAQAKFSIYVAKFSIYVIHGLRGVFRNVTLSISVNTLYPCSFRSNCSIDPKKTAINRMVSNSFYKTSRSKSFSK